jgi:hypothetical protein
MLAKKLAEKRKSFFSQSRGVGMNDLDARISLKSPAFDVRDYGAVGDGKRCTTVVSNSGSKSVSCTTAAWTQADVGKKILIFNEASAGTITTIATVTDATHIVLAANAGITTTTGSLIYGTDDASAIQSCLNAAAAYVSQGDLTDPNIEGISSHVQVVIPNSRVQGIYLFASQLTIPTGVYLEGTGTLANFISDRTANAIIVQPFTTIHRMDLENLHGGNGVVCGTASQQAHVYIDTLKIYHTGTSYTALVLNGYHYTIYSVFIKRAGIGIKHSAGSDCTFITAFVIGCTDGVDMNASNQVFYTSLFLDTCGGASTRGGLIINNECSNVYVNLQAFQIVGSTVDLDPVISIGQEDTDVNKMIHIVAQANNTGGSMLEFAYAQETIIELLCSNVLFASGVNNAITTGVVFGSGLAGFNKVTAQLAAGITPYSGTYYDGYTYYQSSVQINPVITEFDKQYHALNYSLSDAATVAVNWNNGNCQSVTLGGNRAITFANPRAGGRYILAITQDGTGSRTITNWPTIKWVNGVTPVLTTAINKTDLFSFYYDGTSYFGQAAYNF